VRPGPIPDDAIWPGARRIVVGPPDGDLTNTDISPVEVLVDVGPDTGMPRISSRCVLEAGDLEKLNEGGVVWVSFYGQTLRPFSVEVVGPDGR
jgi:hypothetical protein